MNVERWVARRQLTWQKLEDLLKQIDKRGLPSLSREELQQLGRLYRSCASDLSRARAMGLGMDITSYLNNLVVKGHNQVYQSPRNRWKDLGHFLWITFPSVFRAHLAYVLAAFLIFMVPTVVVWSMIMDDINVARMELRPGSPLVSDEMWNYIEQKKMWTDSLQHESPAGSSFIATNNIRVCILGFALGLTFGIGTIFILVMNGLMLGGTFAVCQHYDMAHRLAAFVAPHGVFELTAIWVSAAGGLVIAKALWLPGPYRRTQALRMAGKPAMILFAGTVPLLLIAGLIEGFISPRTDIAQEVKYSVSLATAAILLLYLFVPRAARQPASAGAVVVSEAKSAAGTGAAEQPQPQLQPQSELARK